ncbi:MAG: GNAT family N-acetyltransferase [Actinomycetota bacterium]
MITGNLIEDPGDLEPWRAGWDALATGSGLPYCAPGWMLPWWRHVAPERSMLRVAIARDGDDVVGIAPFFATRSKGLVRYGLLGLGVSPQREPLVRPDVGREAVQALCWALSVADPPPDLVTFDGIRAGSSVSSQMVATWPGKRRPFIHRDLKRGVPFMSLSGGGFEAWLDSKSKNFRQGMRRGRRRLEQHGGHATLACSRSETMSALTSFFGLHHARWASRGGSAVLTPKVEAMLLEVGAELSAGNRLRVWSIEVEGRPVSVQLFVCAGGNVSYWLGGFDEGWAQYRPAMQTLLASLEHAWSVGDARFELGPGRQEYKYRLADEEQTLERLTLVPPTGRFPLARAELTLKRIGRGAYGQIRARRASSRLMGRARKFVEGQR